MCLQYIVAEVSTDEWEMVLVLVDTIGGEKDNQTSVGILNEQYLL